MHLSKVLIKNKCAVHLTVVYSFRDIDEET